MVTEFCLENQKINDSFRTQILEYPDMKVCKIENFDYNKLKLFLLSVLWRAHISKHNFFNLINLNSRANNISKSVLTGNADLCNDVKISIFGLMFNRNNLFKTVLNPRHVVCEGIDIYCFMIHGIVYNFIYKDDNNSFHLGNNTLTSTQPLEIPFYLGADAANYFRAVVFPRGSATIS